MQDDARQALMTAADAGPSRAGAPAPPSARLPRQLAIATAPRDGRSEENACYDRSEALTDLMR